MRNRMLPARVTVAVAMFAVLCLTGLTMAQDKEPPMKRLPPPNPNAGFLGAKFSPITDEAMEELKLDSQDGVFVVELVEGAPAEKGDMLANDVIKKIDGKDVPGVEEFVQTMSQSKPGQEMKFTVLRGKETKEMAITLGKRPAMKDADKDHDMDHDKDHDGAHKKEPPATKPN